MTQHSKNSYLHIIQVLNLFLMINQQLHENYARCKAISDYSY